jgi:hypothetical protein
VRATNIAAQSVRLGAETFSRFVIRADGQHQWGDGTGSTDTFLYRNAAGDLRTDAILRADNFKAGPASGSVVAFGSRIGAEGNDRIAVLGDGTIQWGVGVSVADVQLWRPGADILELDDEFRIVRTLPTSQLALQVREPGGAQPYFRIRGDGRLDWGDGTNAVDTALYRSAASVLTSDDKLDPASLNLQVKAGVPVDGDIVGGAASGDIVLDTTNNKIMVRVGATWKGVVVA